MKALILDEMMDVSLNKNPLKGVNLPIPVPSKDEVLIQVSACGVCHTELDEIEGRLPPPRLPVVLGHQVIGRVVDRGVSVNRLQVGERVGVAWIYASCGRCAYCLSGQENLCPEFRGTGRDADGGYAQYMVVPEVSAFPIPSVFIDVDAAPLLCAGAIGYRSLRLTELQDGQSLGLTGFGASAHLVLQLAKHIYPNSGIYAFARSESERSFARQLGAAWVGDTFDTPPIKLHAIIDTTPVWKPVLQALNHLSPGGRLVINAIRKEESDKSILLELDYPAHLWHEKEIKSVANVTRRDVSEFMELAAQIPIRPEVQVYPFEEANQALIDLKERKIRGAKVLMIS